MRPESGGRRIALGAGWALAAAAMAGAALLCPLRPLALFFPDGGLDGSWITVLGEAATRPARWGVDLAFTYGPASALVTRYFTDGYLAAAVPVLAAVAAVSGACLLALIRSGTAGRGGKVVGALAVAAWVAGLVPQGAQDGDGFTFALAFALFLLDLQRRPGDRGAAATVAAGAALFGVLAVAKTSYGALALGLSALADLRAAVALRRAPLPTPLLLAGALAAFLLLGQRIGDLPAYLDLQGQVAAGYGAAMYLPPDRAEAAAYLVAGGALAAAAAALGPPGRGGRLAAGLGAALAVALAFKAGFVRADTHTQIGWSLLGLGGLAAAVGLAMPRSRGAAAALGAASLAVIWAAAPVLLLASPDRPADLAGLPDVYHSMAGPPVAEARAWARLLADPEGFAAEARRAKDVAWARARAARPLPALAGSVDMIPSEQGAILAAGLDYDPRPSFQEYATYTSGLIAANLAFYAGPRAPDWVFWGLGGLDDRYPNMTEGALWPALLSGYEPVRRAGEMLLLRRRAAPLPDALGPPERRRAGFGERVPVPGPGPVFARITVRENPLGRLAALLFRPPPLSLQVSTADGRVADYRFVPALGAAGFLLSPSVAGPDAFANIALGTGDGGDGAAVTGFAVGASRTARLFYAPAVEVELRPVEVRAPAPSADAAALAADLARGRPWRQLVRRIGRAGALSGNLLSAPAPTALTVPTDGARRLRVGFGVADGAWTVGHTRGVCFAVSAPGGAEPLWRRCLDPAALPADRGPQGAEVELPPGTRAVTAATSCPTGCEWGWSYWDDIAPEP